MLHICQIKINFVHYNRIQTYRIMKRKDLKKKVNYLCGELMAEAVALLHYGNPANQDDVDNVMLNILSMQNDLICRLSHIEPGSTKLFFKKFNEDMANHTDEIIDQIKALV